ncbi:MAG: hypothetical protein LBV12_10870 [Puniceicoccales bacterium]|jgi:hypothetical protein|nr:hypothetical protein [Puniceicoccales bacterium]
MESAQQKKEPLTMSAEEAAGILCTTPDKVRAAILNGTMPVGLVAQGDHSSHNRTIIIRRRFSLWLEGELRL